MQIVKVHKNLICSKCGLELSRPALKRRHEEKCGLKKKVECTPLELSLLELLKNASNPLSRDEMVDFFGMPRTTIYDALHRLEKKGIVKPEPEYRTDQARGRPVTVWRLIINDK